MATTLNSLGNYTAGLNSADLNNGRFSYDTEILYGTGNPTGVVVPDALQAVYYDTANNNKRYEYYTGSWH